MSSLSRDEMMERTLARGRINAFAFFRGDSSVYGVHFSPRAVTKPCPLCAGIYGPGWSPKQVWRDRACFKGADLFSRCFGCFVFIYLSVLFLAL
jgi:hypothetical protein